MKVKVWFETVEEGKVCPGHEVVEVHDRHNPCSKAEELLRARESGPGREFRFLAAEVVR